MNNPIFCVSDLHMGDGGPRDNFQHMANGQRLREFNQFLDYVDDRHGKLYIIGDLFELWQGNISKVITERMTLLDRLADMEATYMLGNHDIDLKYFSAPSEVRLAHRLFRHMPLKHKFRFGGRSILLIHGHEQDPYCASDAPGIGRISAIYTGIKEDRNGGPMLNKRTTVEADTLGRLGWLGNLARKCMRKPSNQVVMRRNMRDLYFNGGHSTIVYGHTHEPGQFIEDGCPLPIYNCGTWAEQTNSFVYIDPNGFMQVRNWIDGDWQPNHTLLKVT